MAQLLNTVSQSGAVAPIWVILQEEKGNYSRLGGKGLALQAWWVRNWNSKFQWAHSWSLLPPKPSSGASKGQRCVWLSLPSIILVSCGSGERSCPHWMPRLTLIHISVCVRGEETGTNENAACFLLGKQKADLQLADISIVTLHWQARQHQWFFWKGRTRVSNVLPPSRSPQPCPPCERSSLSAGAEWVSVALQGDIMAALSEPLRLWCPARTDSLLQPLTWALPALCHFSTLRSLLGTAACALLLCCLPDQPPRPWEGVS